MAKKRRSSAQVKYNNLQKVKGKRCRGEATQAQLNKAKAEYIAAAVKAGKPKSEAQKSANKVAGAACSVSGTKKTKRKPASRKRSTSKRRKTTRRR